MSDESRKYKHYHITGNTQLLSVCFIPYYLIFLVSVSSSTKVQMRKEGCKDGGGWSSVDGPHSPS